MSNAEGRVNGALYFDFPKDVSAPGAPPNFDPSLVDLDIAAWSEYEQGYPKRHQGVPRLLEVISEGEDIPPDLIMDQCLGSTGEDAFKVYFTGRLTGSIVRALAQGQHECEIIASLVPTIRPGDPIPLTKPDGTNDNLMLVMEDVECAGTNMWGWLNDEKKEYICTLEYIHSANALVTDEVYRVVIRWKFWMTPQDGDKVLQPWSGFDDAVHFSVRGACS